MSVPFKPCARRRHHLGHWLWLLRAIEDCCRQLLQKRADALRVGLRCRCRLCRHRCRRWSRREATEGIARVQATEEEGARLRGSLPEELRHGGLQDGCEMPLKEAGISQLVYSSFPRGLLPIDGHQLHRKGQVRVGGDASRHATLTVSGCRRHQQETAGAQGQLLDALVPAPDDCPIAHHKLEGVAIPGRVELGASTQQCADVMHGHFVSHLRHGSNVALGL
mmetsp:Transcript_39729/g.84800  ORF Transcript_39729/g.84800 Transcript_39729/m.84800 type:complete len:222 (-) Transcript_39729:670-1335(-)